MIQKDITEIQPVHSDPSALSGKGVLLYDRETGEAVAFDAARLSTASGTASFDLMKTSKFCNDYAPHAEQWVRSCNLCFRFRGTLPPDDWTIEYYMYNNAKSKTQWKLIGTDPISAFRQPYADKEGDGRYRFLVSPRSLVDLFRSKFVPDGDTPGSDTPTSELLGLWSAVLNDSGGTKGAWRYGDSVKDHFGYNWKPYESPAPRYSGNFGVRLVSADGRTAGALAVFRISIMKVTYGDGGTYMHHFTIKTNVGTR